MIANRARHSLVAAAVVALTLLALPSGARAGTYVVTACQGDFVNNSWQPFKSNEHVEAFTSCSGEGLTARNSGGYLSVPPWSRGMVYFDAPPGARIVRVSGEANQNSTGRWLAGIHDEGLNQWLWCGPGCVSTFDTWAQFDIGNLSTGRIAAVVECGDSPCERQNQVRGRITIRNVSVVVADERPPDVGISGGSLVSGGWKRGVQSVEVAASDAVGVRETSARLGSSEETRDKHSCDYSHTAPCPNGMDSLELDTRTVADGHRTLTASARDTPNNLAEVVRDIAIDNTAPLSPQGLSVASGEAWRNENRFHLTWSSPDQHGMSPVTGSKFNVCPASTPSDGDANCQPGSRNGDRGADIEAPGPGTWTARLWLRDEPGNDDVRTAREVTLRFDPDAPSVSLVNGDDADPTRIRVRATDTVSGLAEGTVEARRQGEDVWRSLPTEFSPDGFSAVIDDEALPEGEYALRARAVDRATNARRPCWTAVKPPWSRCRCD